MKYDKKIFCEFMDDQVQEIAKFINSLPPESKMTQNDAVLLWISLHAREFKHKWEASHKK